MKQQQHYRLKGIDRLPKGLSINGGDFSRTNSPFSNHLPLIHQFLGKTVFIEVEGLTVHGKLIRYDLGRKEKPHKPFILILENGQGKHVLRGNFVSISEGAVK